MIEAGWQLRSRKDILPQETTRLWDKRLVEDEAAAFAQVSFGAGMDQCSVDRGAVSSPGFERWLQVSLGQMWAVFLVFLSLSIPACRGEVASQAASSVLPSPPLSGLADELPLPRAILRAAAVLVRDCLYQQHGQKIRHSTGSRRKARG